MSHSGLQAGTGTRRSAQARVAPLSSAGTPVRCLPEVPNPVIFNDRPGRAGPQAALPHLAVEWLQRRWAALLRTGAPRLNTIYIVAGLIIVPVLEKQFYTRYSHGILFKQKMPDRYRNNETGL